MTRIFVLSVFVLILSFVYGDTVALSRPLHKPDAEFFLQTNDDVMEALQAYAETLCLQDKLVGHSPQLLLAAGAQCGDSKRTEKGDSLTHDGKWHDYVWLAYADIIALCSDAANQYELCKWFKK